ncbi:MAG: hypothetical protein ACREJB_05530, partial [Planctomycetaceae bacterium]
APPVDGVTAPQGATPAETAPPIEGGLLNDPGAIIPQAAPPQAAPQADPNAAPPSDTTPPGLAAPDTGGETQNTIPPAASPPQQP